MRFEGVEKGWENGKKTIKPKSSSKIKRFSSTEKRLKIPKKKTLKTTLKQTTEN